MADYNTYRTAQGVGHRTAAVDQGLRAYMNKVYGLMAVGMGVTATTAYGTATAAMTNPAVANTLYNSPLRWVIMFAPLLMVFAFGAALNRLSV